MMAEYQNLIGTIVTLTAAFIGFAGVIYSQRAIVRNSRLQAEAQAAKALRSFQNAIVGELSALKLSIDDSLKLLDSQIGMAEEMVKMGGSKKTQPRVTFLFATPVFDNLVSHVGLLTPDLSFKISSLYGRLKSLSLKLQSDVPEMEASIAARVMNSVSAGLTELQREIEDLKLALGANVQGSPKEKK